MPDLKIAPVVALWFCFFTAPSPGAEPPPNIDKRLVSLGASDVVNIVVDDGADLVLRAKTPGSLSRVTVWESQGYALFKQREIVLLDLNTGLVRSESGSSRQVQLQYGAKDAGRIEVYARLPAGVLATDYQRPVASSVSPAPHQYEVAGPETFVVDVRSIRLVATEAVPLRVPVSISIDGVPVHSLTTGSTITVLQRGVDDTVAASTASRVLVKVAAGRHVLSLQAASPLESRVQALEKLLVDQPFPGMDVSRRSLQHAADERAQSLARYRLNLEALQEGPTTRARGRDIYNAALSDSTLSRIDVDTLEAAHFYYRDIAVQSASPVAVKSATYVAPRYSDESPATAQLDVAVAKQVVESIPELKFYRLEQGRTLKFAVDAAAQATRLRLAALFDDSVTTPLRFRLRLSDGQEIGLQLAPQLLGAARNQLGMRELAIQALSRADPTWTIPVVSHAALLELPIPRGVTAVTAEAADAGLWFTAQQMIARSDRVADDTSAEPAGDDAAPARGGLADPMNILAERCLAARAATSDEENRLLSLFGCATNPASHADAEQWLQQLRSEDDAPTREFAAVLNEAVARYGIGAARDAANQRFAQAEDSVAAVWRVVPDVPTLSIGIEPLYRADDTLAGSTWRTAAGSPTKWTLSGPGKFRLRWQALMDVESSRSVPGWLMLDLSGSSYAAPIGGMRVSSPLRTGDPAERVAQAQYVEFELGAADHELTVVPQQGSGLLRLEGLMTTSASSQLTASAKHAVPGAVSLQPGSTVPFAAGTLPSHSNWETIYKLEQLALGSEKWNLFVAAWQAANKLAAGAEREQQLARLRAISQVEDLPLDERYISWRRQSQRLQPTGVLAQRRALLSTATPFALSGGDGVGFTIPAGQQLQITAIGRRLPFEAGQAVSLSITEVGRATDILELGWGQTKSWRSGVFSAGGAVELQVSGSDVGWVDLTFQTKRGDDEWQDFVPGINRRYQLISEARPLTIAPQRQQLLQVEYYAPEGNQLQYVLPDQQTAYTIEPRPGRANDRVRVSRITLQPRSLLPSAVLSDASAASTKPLAFDSLQLEPASLAPAQPLGSTYGMSYQHRRSGDLEDSIADEQSLSALAVQLRRRLTGTNLWSRTELQFATPSRGQEILGARQWLDGNFAQGRWRSRTLLQFMRQDLPGTSASAAMALGELSFRPDLASNRSSETYARFTRRWLWGAAAAGSLAQVSEEVSSPYRRNHLEALELGQELRGRPWLDAEWRGEAFVRSNPLRQASVDQFGAKVAWRQYLHGLTLGTEVGVRRFLADDARSRSSNRVDFKLNGTWASWGPRAGRMIRGEVGYDATNGKLEFNLGMEWFLHHGRRLSDFRLAEIPFRDWYSANAQAVGTL